MRASTLSFNGHQMQLVETQVPPPTGSQALIRAEYSNISIGTETAFIAKASHNGQPAPPLGYSLVGTVDDVGPDARVSAGDRVLALAPHSSAVVAEAAPGHLTPLPAELDPALATLGTMASVAMHVVQRAGLRLGESAVVLGYGLLGALTAQLLKLGGARWVGVAEPEEYRRQLARQLGADAVFDPGGGEPTEELAHAGCHAGVDVAFETAGDASVFPAALDMLRIGGRLVCCSTFLEGLDVPLYPAIVDKELTLIGAHQPKCPLLRAPYYPHSQLENRRWALQLLADGRLRAGELVTHVIPFEQAPAFYDRLLTDRSVLGAVIQWAAPEGGCSG